jgi:uncharacterized protein YukJ
MISDHTKLRLELFFWDEQVQTATQSLLYLESHQGSESLTHKLGYFDFGRSRTSIIKAQTHYRERVPSSNCNSLDNFP